VINFTICNRYCGYLTHCILGYISCVCVCVCVYIYIYIRLFGSCLSIIEVLSRQLPGGFEENHENSKDSRCPSQDSSQAPPRHVQGLTFTPTLLLSKYD
jgi:hypothetical protein